MKSIMLVFVGWALSVYQPVPQSLAILLAKGVRFARTAIVAAEAHAATVAKQ